MLIKKNWTEQTRGRRFSRFGVSFFFFFWNIRQNIIEKVQQKIFAAWFSGHLVFSMNYNDLKCDNGPLILSKNYSPI